MSSIVEEIFEERQQQFGTKKPQGTVYYSKSTLWPQHKEDNIDRICVERMKKGESYADWQKEQYPVKVHFPWDAPISSK